MYLEGEFIGGCDIMLQMHQVVTGNIEIAKHFHPTENIFTHFIPQSGELIEELGKVGIKSALVSETEEK